MKWYQKASKKIDNCWYRIANQNIYFSISSLKARRFQTISQASILSLENIQSEEDAAIFAAITAANQ